MLDLNSAWSSQVGATLRHISPHLYMWVQDGVDVPQTALAQSAQTFEERLYPTVRNYFGSEWTPGIDNDPRLTVLNARIAGAAGYFSSVDEYPQSIMPSSNSREMFYMNVSAIAPRSTAYEGTLAHEFQHMVHWFADSNEDAWISEGASKLAEHLCGYSTQYIVSTFSSNPDTQLTAWDAAPGSLMAHYGASFLFLAYLAERFGPETMRAVVASPENGIAGVVAGLRAGHIDLTFEELFADWAVANYADGQNQAPYMYRDIDVQVGVAQTLASYPTSGAGTVHQYATDYIELPPTAEELRLTISGETTTRLVPTDAHSGPYFWWSNRGDNSNMTLTRPFDLSGVKEVTLHAWLWYDIEEDWDYAYVEASADGGATWRILPGRYTATDNPGGNSYGAGYTGLSGSRAEALWVEETFDLSAFAGQSVLIRFEYVTDDAVDHFGMCIDDIAIPELGYSYDAEQGEDGWVARGFVRTDNRLPQRYLVQVLRLGEGLTVERRFFTGEESLALAVPALDADTGRTVLAISALTPFSTAPARYQYEVSAAN